MTLRRHAYPRRAVYVGLMAALALAPLSACGVPTDGPATAVGRAPGAGGPVDRPDAKLPDATGIASPTDLVERYLQAAAAGDWDPAAREQRIDRAAQQARQFLTVDAASVWQPGTQIVIVDVSSFRQGVDFVDANVTPVGVLDEYGSADRLPDAGLSAPLGAVHFQTRRDSSTSGEWRLTNPPNVLMLSSTGLTTLFDVRPVYFWDPVYNHLVPDRRYLARGVSREKRIREVVDRLIQGPSEWLKPAVLRLPDGTTTDNPVLDGSKIIINLSAAAGLSNRLRQLAWQLRWSLQPEKLPLELRIANRTQLVDSDDTYLGKNAALAASGEDGSNLFAVLDGRALAVDSQGGEPKVLAAAENSAVVSAALSRGRDAAALVRQAGAAQELWLGSGRDRAAASFVRAPLPAVSSMSQPSYLAGTANRVLVAAAGTLYDVSQDGGTRTVSLPASYSPVTAVSVAPDGRRLALVAGDRVLVATVITEGSQVSLASLRELSLGGLSNLRGVSWAYEHQLVVAGATSAVSVSIDNAIREPVAIANLGSSQVTAVACATRSPLDGRGAPIVIEAGALGSYYVYASSGLVPVTVNPPGGRGPSRANESPASAAPSSSGPVPGSAPTPAPVLHAPFYLDPE